MNRDDALAEFKQANAILNGHFILSSGLHSDTYLQCARVLMEADRADRLCNALAQKIDADLLTQIDMVVAPAMGGVIVGYEMGRQLKKTSVFCERVDGKFSLRRGFDISEGAKVLVIEDVVTTGKSSKEAFTCIEEYGGKVIAEACLVDRSGGNADLGVPLFSLLQVDVITYQPDQLPDYLQNIPAVKPGSRFIKS